MNKSIASIGIIFAIFLVAYTPNLMIQEVRSWTNPYTDEFVVHVNLANHANSNTKGVRVTAQIFDLDNTGDIYERTLTDLTLKSGEHDSRLLTINMPEDVKPGLYLTKIVASNDKYRDIRWVYVQVPGSFV